MKNAFTLLEIIVVIVIISLLSVFIISKSQNSINFTVKTKIKSDIALIRNSIAKVKTKNILLNDDSSFSLDNANSNEENSELFSNILDFPLLSTTNEIKEAGKWIKVSSNNYTIYSNENENIEFIFEDNFFNCKSEISICKEYE